MKNNLINLTNLPKITIKINTLWLLQHSMLDNMNASDIIIRYMFIEHYYGKPNNGLELYSTMQRTRVKYNKHVPKYRDDNGKRFVQLIKSFEKKGYDSNYPIQLNKYFVVFDGCHRLALALYHNIEEVDVCFNEPVDFVPNYSLNWFDEVNLSEYKEIIRKKYQDILISKSKRYFLIIPNNKKIELDKLKETFHYEVINDIDLYTKNKISKKDFNIVLLIDVAPEYDVKYIKSKKVIKNLNEEKVIDFVRKNDLKFINEDKNV